MKKREDLFHLIQAMSKSEKRYFTLDAKKSSNKESKYLELFQAVNDLEIYDETKLKKKFGKNLPYDKSYLYEAIMRSMRDYRSSNSYAARIKEMILDAQYLYERSLYEQCGERLEEAKQLAVEMDDQLSLMEINKSERMLLRQMKGKAYEENMATLMKETKCIVQSMEEELKYLNLLDLLVLEVDKKFALKGAKEVAEFKERFPEKEIDGLPSPISGRAKLRLLQSKAHYYQLLGNPDGILEQYSAVVEWWDENKKIKEEEFHRYIIDVSSLLYAYYTKGAYHKFPPLLNKLDEEKPRNQHDQGVVFQKVMTYKLLFYINTGHNQGIEDVVSNVKKGLNRYQMKDSTRNSLIFNTSVMLFVLEKFDQCFEWNSMIIKGNKFSIRRDQMNGVMLINLVASYDLEADDLFESTLRAAQRYFQKKETKSSEKFEIKILSILRSLYFSPISETYPIYKELKTYLVEVINNPSLKIPLGLDELLLWWVDSKLEKGTIIHQIQKQNRKSKV